MGFSLKKIVKSVTKPVSNVVNGVGKIASGKISEGLGDIGQTAAGTGLDIVTGGNKKIADGLSGGLLTTAENAARGNTADIARLGVTGGAALAGGPGAALAANSAFANGGNILQAGFSGVLGSDTGLGNFLNNSALGNLASGALSGLINGKPKPVASVPDFYPQETSSAYSPSVKNNNMPLILGIGALFVLLVVFMFFILKRRK